MAMMQIDEGILQRFESQSNYVIALQRAIEYHCKDAILPESKFMECPHHALLLQKHKLVSDYNKVELARMKVELARVRSALCERCTQLINEFPPCSRCKGLVHSVYSFIDQDTTESWIECQKCGWRLTQPGPGCVPSEAQKKKALAALEEKP